MSQEALDQIRDKNDKSSKASTNKNNKLRNVSDFIWSKLTNSRKNSSLNITKNISETKLVHSATLKDSKCLIDSTNTKNEKKSLRNIFHIFESTSKLKLNTGVNKKNLKNNKSPSKVQVKSENTTDLSQEVPNETILVQKNEDLVPDLDSFKITLMDNSILKSKISAAKRNPRNRQVTPKPESNLNKSNSYQTIDDKTSKVSMDIIDENSAISDKEKLESSQFSTSLDNNSIDTISKGKENLDASIKLDLISTKMPQKEDDKVKIAIYDNNMSECSTYEDNSSSFDIFESLTNQFKSKSCEKFNTSTSNTDSNNNNLKHGNNQRNFNFIKNNRYSYFDTNKIDKIELGKVVLKSLSHSRSLKLNQKSSECDESEPSQNNGTDESVPIFKSIGQLSNSYKIPNSKKREPLVAKCAENSEEPVWKELAFRKHNAWSRKNYCSPVSEKPSENIEKTNEQLSFEGKVKSMVRDLQKT